MRSGKKSGKMSEENENELDNVIAVCSALEDIGERKIANALFKKRIENKLELVETDEWVDHAICDSYPIVDARQLVYCCPATKHCIFRNSVLKKIGMSVKEYTEMKKRWAEELEGDSKALKYVKGLRVLE